MGAPPNLSYSQANSLADCGARYYYERVQKLPQTTSWAQVGGSALHKMTELWDLAQYGAGGVNLDSVPTFGEALEEAILEQEERGGDRKEFRATGRKSAAWPDKENDKWWLHHGPVFFQKWIEWRRMTNWEIWFDDAGNPGIEVGVNFTLDDGTPMVLYIDRVMIQPSGLPVVVDLKSGREPKGSQQLGLYKYGLELGHGLPVDYGGFWMARTGMMGELWDLRSYTKKRIEYDYGVAAEMKRKNLYVAHPGDFCGNCAGRDFCPAVGGARAHEIDQPWDYKGDS